MGIWVKNNYKLRGLIENLARAEFRRSRDPMKVILWYIALNKKNILLGLFKTDTRYERVYHFLSNDFT